MSDDENGKWRQIIVYAESGQMDDVKREFPREYVKYYLPLCEMEKKAKKRRNISKTITKIGKTPRLLPPLPTSPEPLMCGHGPDSKFGFTFGDYDDYASLIGDGGDS